MSISDREEIKSEELPIWQIPTQGLIEKILLYSIFVKQ